MGKEAAKKAPKSKAAKKDIQGVQTWLHLDDEQKRLERFRTSMSRYYHDTRASRSVLIEHVACLVKAGLEAYFQKRVTQCTMNVAPNVLTQYILKVHPNMHLVVEIFNIP
jgi:hypothetical protein